MFKQLLAAALIISGVTGIVGPADADTSVRGYYRKDGTYVAPHTRSSPNDRYNDNYSVRPNVNPYTGQPGTREPTWNDRPPPADPYGLNAPRRRY